MASSRASNATPYAKAEFAAKREISDVKMEIPG
jgi:hypothetical protein